MNLFLILELSAVALFLVAASMPSFGGKKVIATPWKPKVLWKEEAEKYNADLRRVQVWDALADTFLDTFYDNDQLEWLAEIIAESPFCMEELMHILQFEVAPVCMPNLFCIAGEWLLFSPDFLIPECLKQQQLHPYRPSGNPDRVPFSAHLLGVGPAEGYYLIYRAQRIRQAAS